MKKFLYQIPRSKNFQGPVSQTPAFWVIGKMWYPVLGFLKVHPQNLYLGFFSLPGPQIGLFGPPQSPPPFAPLAFKWPPANKS